jgi:hypothetical protein
MMRNRRLRRGSLGLRQDTLEPLGPKRHEIAVAVDRGVHHAHEFGVSATRRGKGESEPIA